ncbi:hypothetical protein BSKO_02167 [Bryopsis sp. KO-2023]|nr:hypothetical protein BSKO_02167 [Bryopsis sp. KO-2023]
MLGDASKEPTEEGRFYIPLIVPLASAQDLLITQGSKLAETLVEETELKTGQPPELSRKQTLVHPETSVEQTQCHRHDPVNLSRKLSSVDPEPSLQQTAQHIQKPANLPRKRAMAFPENSVDSSATPAHVRQRTSYHGEQKHAAEAQSVKLIEIEANPGIDSGGSPIFLAVDDDGNLVNIATALNALEGIRAIPKVHKDCSERGPQEHKAATIGHVVKREGGRNPGHQERVTSRAECETLWSKSHGGGPYIARGGVGRYNQTLMSPSLFSNLRAGQQEDERSLGDHLFFRKAESLVEEASRIQARTIVGRTMIEPEDPIPVPQLNCFESQDYRLSAQDILQSSGGLPVTQPGAARADRDPRKKSMGFSSSISSNHSHEKTLAVPAPLGRMKASVGKGVIKGKVLEQRLMFPWRLNAQQQSSAFGAPEKSKSTAVHKGKVIVLHPN